MPRNSRSVFSILLLGAVAVAPAACSKDDASQTPSSGQTAATPQASAQAQEDLQDVTKYKLSMDKIDKYIQAQRNIAAKYKSMTPAQRQALKDRGDANDASDPNASLDQMAARIEKEPVLVDAIKSAGLSPREFMMVTLSMMQTGMAASVAKMRPNDNQDSLIRAMQANPDNIKWYNEHEAEITQKMKAIEAEMKGMESDA
ncbi:MAG TPA: hypothetical protein VF042_00435 [Gemmatimonadaceae bacterium]